MYRVRRCGQRYRLHLCLWCSLWLALLPLAVPLSPVHAQTEDPALELLHQAAIRGTPRQRLYAGFRQEKRVSVLTRPLISEGYFCYTRGAITTGTDGAQGQERLLWAYTSPIPSGFIYEHGHGALWQGSPEQVRPAADPREAAAVTAMVQQVLQWLRPDPENLRHSYALEQPDPRVPALLLQPRRPLFFVRLEALFAPDLTSIRRLIFTEANGDSVRLDFTQTQRDGPLPPWCAQPSGGAAPHTNAYPSGSSRHVPSEDGR